WLMSAPPSDRIHSQPRSRPGSRASPGSEASTGAGCVLIGWAESCKASTRFPGKVQRPQGSLSAPPGGPLSETAMHRDPTRPSPPRQPGGDNHVCRGSPVAAAKPSLSLIFPTYNPGPRLERTWEEVGRFVRTAAADWEVLFVCDGCT